MKKIFFLIILFSFNASAEDNLKGTRLFCNLYNTYFFSFEFLSSSKVKISEINPYNLEKKLTFNNKKYFTEPTNIIIDNYIVIDRSSLSFGKYECDIDNNSNLTKKMLEIHKKLIEATKTKNKI